MKKKFPRNGMGLQIVPCHHTQRKYRRNMKADRINHVRGVLGMSKANAEQFIKRQVAA